MEVSAVAKISNNGSTYHFTDNEQLMDMLAQSGWRMGGSVG